MRAVIASGSGPYADPWHPFARTSEALAVLAEGAGYEVQIDDDVDDAMRRLQDVDLLIVNAGDSWRSTEAHHRVESASIEGLAQALEHGIGVFAAHSAVTSLRDYPEWPLAVGGMWVPGLSWHPPADVIPVTGGSLPAGDHVSGFDVFDERYARLQRLGRSHVVATHIVDGRPEPTAWVRHFGASRIAVDVLGHDERSYESKGHRELATRLMAWCGER